MGDDDFEAGIAQIAVGFCEDTDWAVLFEGGPGPGAFGEFGWERIFHSGEGMFYVEQFGFGFGGVIWGFTYHEMALDLVG